MKILKVNNPPHEARGVHESASQSVSAQATLFHDTPSDGVQVEVLRIVPVANRGNLQAFADVKLSTPLGAFIFRRCRVIQQPNQRAYVSLPQEEWTGRNGKRGYTTLITPPDAIAEVIYTAILQAWEVFRHG